MDESKAEVSRDSPDSLIVPFYGKTGYLIKRLCRIQIWEALTQVAVRELGALESRLYQKEDGTLVSIACWEGEAAWREWKDVLATHPFREKWRQYKIGEPIGLTLLKEVSRAGSRA